MGRQGGKSYADGWEGGRGTLLKMSCKFDRLSRLRFVAFIGVRGMDAGTPQAVILTDEHRA